MTTQLSHLTLSQLQRSIQSAIESHLPSSQWVSGEIADLKVNGAGHCYIELIEKGASDGVAKAQARAVIWRSAYSAIAAHFISQTGEQLGRGITILARVTVSYHELYGLSLQILEIDPTYTMGEVERQRQQAIARLKGNGSWDANRSLLMPTLVQRVAVISSSKAAGFQDFMREVERGGYHLSLRLFEATMQGAGAEESIIEALIAIAKLREEFDAVVVIRGGGATNDLNCFNSYRLALHFARFPLPVISGIGHDKDITIVDMVAQVSLKTPTAVAGWLIERMQGLDLWLQNAALELHSCAVQRARREEITLEGYLSQLTTRCEEFINQNKRELIDRLAQLPDLAYGLIESKRQQIDHAAEIIEGYSPERLLKIGFSIVRGVREVKGVNIGSDITIQLSDGEIDAEIKEIRYGGR